MTILNKFSVPGAAIAISAAISASAVASGHSESTRLHPDNPGIDMIVTGTNKRTRHVGPLPDDRQDCGLCYHRDKLNKAEDRRNKRIQQPFPGE